jgi:UDP-2-acetamido-3-amino-2,3-dideoxy-glucuronate N-acetyltransferase
MIQCTSLSRRQYEIIDEAIRAELRKAQADSGRLYQHRRKIDMERDQPSIHPTAEVSPQATIGPGTRVWHQVQIRERASLGSNCIVGKGAYIDFDVPIGNNVKIQNSVFVYHGVTVEDGVFLGPGVILTNDKLPRAINPDGTLKSDADWQVSPTLIKRGAAIGAGAIVLPGITIGEFGLVGAGAVVTHDVPDHGLVYGNPAQLHGYVCKCARSMSQDESGAWFCATCDQRFELPAL